MIFVGIDVAKDKHDCFISNSDDKVLYKVFTITNNLEGSGKRMFISRAMETFSFARSFTLSKR